MRHILMTVFALAFICAQTQAAVVAKAVSYTQNGTTMKGLIAYDDATHGPRPGILVVHEWWGHNAYARSRARQLAKLGYTALAVDMYGDGKTADHPKQAGEFSSAIAKNLPLARARFEAALDTLKKDPTVDSKHIAAIGYCFGGGVVLQMARLGEDIDGVVSFHGSLASDIHPKKGQVKAAIRVFQGADDPFVKPKDIETLKHDMKAANVDFEFVSYPGVKHSFTNPDATAIGEKFGLPLVYDAQADRDSWTQMQAFFKQIFDR